MVDDYLPVADEFQERVDRMQELLFANRPLHRNLLAEIFDLKKQAQLFRLAAFPMRDILSPILRRDIDLFPEAVLAYFRDVYDHSVRVIDQLESLRDLTASALEIHLSVISTRQREVAKQLTVIATIFLPLTFITGFFGQNFSFLVNEILPGRAAFFGLGIGTELLVLGVTLGYFKWKGWF